MSDLLPRDVECKLREFLIAGKTGQMVLHIKDGSILAANLSESIHVDTAGVRVER